MFPYSFLNRPASLTHIIVTTMIVSSHNFTSVTDIFGCTLARNRTVRFSAPLAVAGWCFRCSLQLQYSSIFSCNLISHVWHYSVWGLDLVGIDHFSKWIVFWEIFHNFQEFCNNICLNIFTVWRVKVDAVPGPCSVFLAFIVVVVYLVKLKFVVILGLIQSLLVWLNCYIENFLVGWKLAKSVVYIFGVYLCTSCAWMHQNNYMDNQDASIWMFLMSIVAEVVFLCTKRFIWILKMNYINPQNDPRYYWMS